jgi:hypothetical protein
MMAAAKVGRNDPCPCGSGKKYKKCHGSPSTPAQDPRTPVTSAKPWGVPGEEHKLWVVPRFKGQPPVSAMDDLAGQPGKYKVQLLFSRPGYPITAEREHKFIDAVIGDSHIMIAKAIKERKPEDVDHVQVNAVAMGRRIDFVGVPNDQGFLGKLVAEADAADFQDAETQACEAIAPFLSSWSLHLDIPVHIETIQVTNLQTHTHSLRVRTPHFEMTFAGGVSTPLSAEFCTYASFYREGLNTRSEFYRFLCFYKVIESIAIRRGRVNKAIREAGGEVKRHDERVPQSPEEILRFLGDIYPWRNSWDELALDQTFPREIRGQKVAHIKDSYLNPIRTGIAHALLKTGEIQITLDRIEDVQRVNKWLPLCRVIARLLLKNEFPTEFSLAMKPIDFLLPGG